MVSFIVYDLVFLVLFTLGVILFLQSGRKNIARQGLLYIYKTQLGVIFMDRIAKRFAKFLRPLQYVVVACGYFLMIGALILLFQSVYIYFTNPLVTQVIKAPPIAPLIPYFPALVGLDCFFPPLYFTYFIIAIGLVAIFHEGAHGIFMRLHKIRIQSTGFAFLGPLLGAFVEQDEKQMNKAKKFPQLAILSAGTFANVLLGIIFAILMALFFSGTFVPAGMHFNSYATVILNASEVLVLDDMMPDDDFIEIGYQGRKYFVPEQIWEQTQLNDAQLVAAYDDSPAFGAKLAGTITSINGVKVISFDDLGKELSKYRPGDPVNIQTVRLDGVYDTSPEPELYEITLGERNGNAYLGIGVIPPSTRGFSRFYQSITSWIRNPFTYYESSLGDFGWFIYFLLWWIVVINVLVAFFNMLPLGILDGGRFFMLTAWGISGSEKFGMKAFRAIHWLILLAFVALMIKWIGIFI